MSRTDHAIENAIYSFYNYKDKPEPLKYWREHDPNLEGMSDEKIDTIQAAAEYVRYSLCDYDDEQYYSLIGHLMNGGITKLQMKGVVYELHY